MFQVWYCTSSRSHTTVAKYAEYIATSFKEAKERLGDKFSINPKVTHHRIYQMSEYQNLYCVLSWSKNLFPRDRFWTIFQFSPNLLIRFPSFISIFTPTDALPDLPINVFFSCGEVWLAGIGFLASAIETCEQEHSKISFCRQSKSKHIG